MNYLAHLYLADDNDDALLGNLLGDFVKGDPTGRYNAVTTEAIIFHRKVDSFSDTHALTRASRQRFSTDRRRFAGIIVDVCYDHFLAKHWHRFAAIELSAFAKKVYDVLETHRNHLPGRLKRILGLMVAEDWLGGYAHINRVGTTLDRIAGRLSRGQQFKGAIAEVMANYANLERDFFAFFPELVVFSQQYKHAGRALSGKSEAEWRF